MASKMLGLLLLLAMLGSFVFAVPGVLGDTQGQPGDEGTNGDENTGQEGASGGQPGQKDGPGPEGNSGP